MTADAVAQGRFGIAFDWLGIERAWLRTRGNSAVVIGIVDQGVVHPNDTVILNVSDGPPLVPVPNVVGDTWAVAKPKLEEAGFKLDYNGFVDTAPSFFTVSSVKPDAGTEQPKGSTLKIKFSG